MKMICLANPVTVCSILRLSWPVDTALPGW